METSISLSGPWEVCWTLISNNTQNPQCSNWPRSLRAVSWVSSSDSGPDRSHAVSQAFVFWELMGTCVSQRGLFMLCSSSDLQRSPQRSSWCLLVSCWLIITHNSERSHRLWRSIQIASCWRQTIVSFMRHEILNDAEIKRLTIRSWNRDSLICVLRCEQQTC